MMRSKSRRLSSLFKYRWLTSRRVSVAGVYLPQLGVSARRATTGSGASSHRRPHSARMYATPAGERPTSRESSLSFSVTSTLLLSAWRWSLPADRIMRVCQCSTRDAPAYGAANSGGKAWPVCSSSSGSEAGLCSGRWPRSTSANGPTETRLPSGAIMSRVLYTGPSCSACGQVATWRFGGQQPPPCRVGAVVRRTSWGSESE